jgi:cellulose synthase/poly-beta-1,6-N-acetylglucosamine synthase-like glycosyltransferase
MIKKLMLITSAIFILLAFLIFLTQTIILVVSLAASSALSVYLLAALKKSQKGRTLHGSTPRHVPFILFFALTIIPITLAVLYAFEDFNTHSIYSIVVAFGMMLTFMYSLVNVPLTIYHKKLERQVPPLILSPPISIIVPAYNEEKAIDKTLRSIIEADYPNKEVIVVDDGSTDNTYALASRYKDSLPAGKFKMLQKEQNRGKFSAINYGIRFATGEFVLVIDADSIVGRDAIKELVKYFHLSDVVAVGGNIKVLNRINLLTYCQALEYLIGINLFKRAFDIFGVVMVVPGPLGGFRRKTLAVIGEFDGDTLTEDFDATVKVLKTGKAVQASSDAMCFTEAPSCMKSLYRQRLRWNRGNLQTMLKHRDIVTNTRYRMLQQYGYPLVFLTMLILPFLGMVVAAFIIMAILLGQWLFILFTFLIFAALEFLLSAIAVVMDKEDWKLTLLAPLLVIGYKQLLDFFVIKSVLDVLFRRDLRWT